MLSETAVKEIQTSILRVLVVDDHAIVRAGVQALLDQTPDIEIVATASSGEEALAMLSAARPDVVLLDYRLPDISGSVVCTEITRRFPRTAVVVLTSYLDDDVLLTCLAAGARGYLTKAGAEPCLPDVLRRVAKGEAVLAPESVERMLEWARVAKVKHIGYGVLAPFEIEILRNLSRGHSVREIASSLRVSEDAVKTSVRSIKRRLGASDRAHAVTLAIKRGII